MNNATLEAKQLARGLVGDPLYLKNLRARLIAGKAAPAVEVVCWYFAYGKPVERVELGADKSLSRLICEAIGVVEPTAPVTPWRAA